MTEATEADLSALGPDLYGVFRRDGTVVRLNANAEQVLGPVAGLAAGAGLMAMVRLQDRLHLAKALDECAVERQVRKVQFSLPEEGAAGERCFELRCLPVRNPALDPDGRLVLGIIRDISERKNLETELQEQITKSQEASLAKSRFLANMSHELRTPLNAILGFSELLQSDAMAAMPPERSAEYVELIHSSAAHLLSVVNDILDMSKIEAGKYQIVAEPFDLVQTIAASCAILHAEAKGKDVRLEVGPMEGIPEIAADERAVKQVLLNLLSNAIKFTDGGGCVRLDAVRSGRTVKISVTDTGIGISPEHVDSLGAPFYQADTRYNRKYEGTGLGLSVVYGLVDLHNGTVKIESECDVGTVVTVTLPIYHAESKPVPASETVTYVKLDQGHAGRKAKNEERGMRRSAMG